LGALVRADALAGLTAAGWAAMTGEVRTHREELEDPSRGV
jgi:hypothetical protein